MVKLRVGLIGIGGMGFCHYNDYKSVDEAEIVAVCDIRTDMAAEKTENAVKIYADYKEMVEKENLDIVDICTPSYLHADMSVYCLAKGINVLCEKPMTLTGADADRVLEAAKKTDKFFMTAHVVRFMRAYEYLKSVVCEKKYGNLVRLDMKRVSSIPRWSWNNWFLDEKLSGGVTTDLSIHDFDFVQSMLGSPDELNAYYRPKKNDSTFVLTVMKYGDAVVTTEGTWYNAEVPFHADYYAVFDNGYVEFTGGRVLDCGKEIDLGATSPAVELGINIKGDDAHRNEIAYFAHCVATGTKPSFVTPDSSAASVKLSDKIKAVAKIID